MHEECKVEQQTECTKSTEDISNIISKTDDLINHLENKLSNVLRQPSPPKDTTDTKDEAPLVPLASELNHQLKRLQAINDIIKNILNRLEN